jgi:hypothetical protein
MYVWGGGRGRQGGSVVDLAQVDALQEGSNLLVYRIFISGLAGTKTHTRALPFLVVVVHVVEEEVQL